MLANNVSPQLAAPRGLFSVHTHAFLALYLADQIRLLEPGPYRDAYIAVAECERDKANEKLAKALRSAIAND